MAWFRISSNVGSSVVVRAESREQAIREFWNTLEEMSRAAVEGLRLGNYVIAEEASVGLGGSTPTGSELRALVYASVPRRAADAPASPVSLNPSG